MKRIDLITLLFVFVISSCDKINGPYRQNDVIPPPSSGDTVVKKVLVEDYTGHTCGNCPAAARMLNDTIKPLFGDRLIILGIHAGYFAEPCPPHTYPSYASYPAYSTDFNTPAGTQWFNDFNIQLSPNGMVNRVKVGSSYAVAPGNWATRINQEMQKEPVLSIKLSPTYNTVTRQLDVTAAIKTLKDMNGNFNLVLGISEDHVIDWQLDYTISPAVPPNYQNNPNYDHRHVFRGAINGVNGFGEQIIAGNAGVGFTASRSYSYTIPTAWNENNCSVVAFVYNTVSKEIVQAEEIKMK